MGEARDDVHVCIMCLRAIMNHQVCTFINKFDIFPLMCAADKVQITELTLIKKILGQFVTDIGKSISQSDIKHIIMWQIKTITSVLKTNIITDILAQPLTLADI